MAHLVKKKKKASHEWDSIFFFESQPESQLNRGLSPSTKEFEAPEANFFLGGRLTFFAGPQKKKKKVSLQTRV